MPFKIVYTLQYNCCLKFKTLELLKKNVLRTVGANAYKSTFSL